MSNSFLGGVCFFPFTDSDSNSSSSDGSQARSVQSSAAHAPPQSSMALESDEPRRSFGIKVQNLPVRSTGEVLIFVSLSVDQVNSLFSEIIVLLLQCLIIVILKMNLSYGIRKYPLIQRQKRSFELF